MKTTRKETASTREEREAREAEEDARDLADLRAAKIEEGDAPTLSLKEVKRELGLSN